MRQYGLLRILTLTGILEVSYVTFCVTNIVMIIVILCLCEIKIKDVTAVSVSISALEILQIGTIPKFMSFISNKLISSVLKIKIELIVSIIVIDLGWNLVNRFILREEKYHVGLEMVESVVFLLYTIAIFDMKMRSLGSSVYNVAMDNIVFIIPFIVIILIIWSFKNIYDDYSRMLISVSVISIVYVVLYLISGKDEISFLRNCVVILGGTLTIINYSLSNTVISYTEKIQNDKKIFEEYKILITNTTILLGTLTGGIVYNSKKIYRFGMEYPF